MTASTEFVQSSDGTRIAYRRLGSGPAVVAVHGGLGSSRSWEAVAQRLAGQHEVFLIDRRGRGESDDGAGEHDLACEVEDVRAVLAAAGPGAALLGHSYGGAVSLELARAADPGEIGALVLYEPAVGVAGLIPADQLDRLHQFVADGAPERALPLTMTLLDAAGLVTADGPSVSLRSDPSPEFRRLAATVPREISAVSALDSDLDRYATIDVPVLLLVGATSPEQAQRNNHALARALRGEVVLLDGFGHVAHTAAPDTVADIVRAFLAAE